MRDRRGGGPPTVEPPEDAAPSRDGAPPRNGPPPALGRVRLRARAHRSPSRRARLTLVASLGCLALAGGCSTPATPPISPSTALAQPGPATPSTSPTSTSPTSTSTSTSTSPAITEIPTVAVTSSTDLVTGLDSPWGLAFLPDGGALVTLRDAARIVRIAPATPATATRAAPTPITGPGADTLASSTAPGGEAGLLGVAIAPVGGPHAGEVYLYRTTARGNQVDRATLTGTTLGDLQPVLTGIPRADHHDGGRLAFGPDGYLYVSTGDAGTTSNAQAPTTLGGKILRLTADGDPAPGNPTPGSPVWSLGHRNVQGLGWAADGRMFASEFGQNTFDELNQITPGANYGWPTVEGIGGAGRGFTDPLATWPTADASPSGLAVTPEGVYLAALRGERLWRVPLTATGTGAPQALLTGTLGRLRTVAVAPDGALWVLTNNTDGRGTPRAGDDRLVRLTVG